MPPCACARTVSLQLLHHSPPHQAWFRNNCRLPAPDAPCYPVLLVPHQPSEAGTIYVHRSCSLASQAQTAQTPLPRGRQRQTTPRICSRARRLTAGRWRASALGWSRRCTGRAWTPQFETRWRARRSTSLALAPQCKRSGPHSLMGSGATGALAVSSAAPSQLRRHSGGGGFFE